MAKDGKRMRRFSLRGDNRLGGAAGGTFCQDRHDAGPDRHSTRKERRPIRVPGRGSSGPGRDSRRQLQRGWPCLSATAAGISKPMIRLADLGLKAGFPNHNTTQHSDPRSRQPRSSSGSSLLVPAPDSHLVASSRQYLFQVQFVRHGKIFFGCSP